MSWAPEVIADNSGQWSGNALRFATKLEAEQWVDDLAMRWVLVRDTRVVESADPVNYEIRCNPQTNRLEFRRIEGDELGGA